MANNDGNIVKRSSQYIDNLGFDEALQVPMGEIVGSPDATTLYRAQVDATGALKVTSLGGASGTQYTDATTNASPIGTVAMGIDPSNVVHALQMDSSGNLKIAGSFSATSTVAAANNTYGTTTSLANAATGTLVNIASSTAGYKITGFQGTGTGDGYFFIQVAGSTILSGRINVTQKSVSVLLPNPVSVTTATAVTLKVTNESGSTADFEGTLLGA